MEVMAVLLTNAIALVFGALVLVVVVGGAFWLLDRLSAEAVTRLWLATVIAFLLGLAWMVGRGILTVAMGAQ